MVNVLTVLGDTPGRFVIRLLILIGIIDGVERGWARPQAEPGQSWHAKLAGYSLSIIYWGSPFMM